MIATIKVGALHVGPWRRGSEACLVTPGPGHRLREEAIRRRACHGIYDDR